MPLVQVVKYIIVEAPTSAALVSAVDAQLLKGFEPCGSVTVYSVAGTQTQRWVQALMIKA